MPWVKVSSEAHKDMKQYLVDVEGVSLGELVEAAFEFSMGKLEEFEKFLGLEEKDEASGEQEEEAEDDSEDEPATDED
ncbi:hypothetical protein MUP01_08660 [Candidatus Bathyarchaeota archaeon]|nr:hypothetical protein [Candidatus Bathyarchaeota archaeon]